MRERRAAFALHVTERCGDPRAVVPIVAISKAEHAAAIAEFADSPA